MSCENSTIAFKGIGIGKLIAGKWKKNIVNDDGIDLILFGNGRNGITRNSVYFITEMPLGDRVKRILVFCAILTGYFFKGRNIDIIYQHAEIWTPAMPFFSNFLVIFRRKAAGMLFMTK